MNLIVDERPDNIVVFGADHVYRMDASQMVAAHIESGAGVTVAGSGCRARRPRLRCHQDGRDGVTIEEFLEKRPTRPAWWTPPRSRSPRWATTSSPPRPSSTRSRSDAKDDGSRHDMGGDIIPMLVDRDAPPSTTSSATTSPARHRDRDYWRDVGRSTATTRRTSTGSALPIFNLYNREWPIFTSHHQLPGAKFVARRLGARLDRLRRVDRLRRDVDSTVIGDHSYVSNGAIGGTAACCSTTSRSARAPSRATRSSTRTSSSPTVPHRVRPRRGPPPRLHRHRQRCRRARQGSPPRPERGTPSQDPRRRRGAACREPKS